MRREKDLLSDSVDATVRTSPSGSRNGRGLLQDAKHVPQPQPTFWDRLLPHGRLIKMTQEAKGVFIPYPLLGIIITLALLVISGIIAIQVQVSNLSTTILLRDADQRAVIQELKSKTEQLQVYIHDDREKLIRLQTEAEKDKRRQ